MTPLYHLDQSAKWRVNGHLESGQLVMEAVKCVNISRPMLSTLWKPFQKPETVVRRPRQDHKRITTASQDRYMVITIHRNRKSAVWNLDSRV
ncbi:transposable element Tcb2 transposase [Trichonephila clavipes]|nr:transposable element Tcb2 transposase [Trichonephila clavipes]